MRKLKEQSFSIIEYFDEFYGNKRLLFDIILSSVFTILLFIFLPGLEQSFYSVDINIKTTIIGFFGVLLGFILTAFSILFVYTPSESMILNNFRKSPSYKDALKSFIGCSFFMFLASALLLILSMIQSKYLFWISVFCIILSTLRFIKCLYYLISLIEINYRIN